MAMINSFNTTGTFTFYYLGQRTTVVVDICRGDLNCKSSWQNRFKSINMYGYYVSSQQHNGQPYRSRHRTNVDLIRYKEPVGKTFYGEEWEQKKATQTTTSHPMKLT